MRKIGFGRQLGISRPCARCPHQLRNSRKRSRYKDSSTHVLNKLEQCPEDIRDCISELKSRAEIGSRQPSHLARQIYYVAKEIGRRIKKIGWYIEEFAITVLAIQAKSEAVQFRFLFGSSIFVINLLPEDALSA